MCNFFMCLGSKFFFGNFLCLNKFVIRLLFSIPFFMFHLTMFFLKKVGIFKSIIFFYGTAGKIELKNNRIFEITRVLINELGAS